MTSHPSKMTPLPTQVVPHLKELESEFQMESMKMSTNITMLAKNKDLTQTMNFPTEYF